MITAGEAHACGRSGFSVICWGANSTGQLGLGTTGFSASPQTVQGLVVGIIWELEAGKSHTCARVAPFIPGQNQLYCWGSDSIGQLGNGAAAGFRSSPQLIASGTWSLRAVGGDSACGKNGANMLCWGRGNSGQLGTGQFQSVSSPTVSPGFSNADMMDFGEEHACAIQADGTVVCSGDGYYGQLGDGVMGYSATPQRIDGFDGLDINDAPVLASQSLTVEEMTKIGTQIGLLVGADPDGDALDYTITAGNTGNVFALDAQSGELTVAGQLDFEAVPTYTLTVSVSDGAAASTATITVNVKDVGGANDANDAPVLAAQSLTVLETASVGTVIGVLPGTDADGDILDYSIVSGNIGNVFALNAQSGELRVAGPLDFESVPAYTLTAAVSDGVDTSTATVTVTVMDAGSSNGIDLSIEISNNRETIFRGRDTLYTIVVRNIGGAVEAATVKADFPGYFNDVVWSCEAVNANCPMGSGVGAPDVLVDMPVESVITFEVVAKTYEPVGADVTAGASVEVPGGLVDLVPENNADADTDVVVFDDRILVDGFED